jgi:hypothetical protein
MVRRRSKILLVIRIVFLTFFDGVSSKTNVRSFFSLQEAVPYLDKPKFGFSVDVTLRVFVKAMIP